MKVGIISDIHSNLYALQEIIKIFDEEKVDIIVNAGDCVGYSPFPNKVVELLREIGVLSAMGNYDDAVANNRPQCGCGESDEKTLMIRDSSLNWTKQDISPENRDYLKNLPALLTINHQGIKIAVMHGGLKALNEKVEETDDILLTEIAGELDANLIVLGHSHKPFIREINGRLFINPGSVGKPEDGIPEGQYALVEFSPDGYIAHLGRFEYPVWMAAESIVNAGLPEEIAESVRMGMRFQDLPGWKVSA